MHSLFDPIMLPVLADICPSHRRIVPAARRGEVEVSDLPLPSNQQAEPAFAEFDKNWDEAVARGEPKLMKVRDFGANPKAARAALLHSLYCYADLLVIICLDTMAHVVRGVCALQVFRCICYYRSTTSKPHPFSRPCHRRC